MYFISITCIFESILCAIFLWQQCNPPQILWDPHVSGTCWDLSESIHFFTFVGGKILSLVFSLTNL